MKKKNKRRSFARRLTRWIAITQFIVMALASYFIYSFSKGFVTVEEASLYMSSLSTANANVERVLTEVSVGTLNHIGEIEENLGNPDKMASIMEKIVAKNSYIRSCGISFIADYYPQKGHWFCPYAVRDENEKIEKRIIGDANNNYLQAEWFTEALKTDSSYWSKPFFERNDTTTPLVSFMTPIRDKQKKTVAVLGADLSLDWIGEITSKGLFLDEDSVNIRLSDNIDMDFDSGFGYTSFINLDWRSVTKKFIIDNDGTFIAHSNKDYIIHKNYFDLAKETPDTIDDQVGKNMVAGKTGAYYKKNGLVVKPLKFFDSDFWSVYIFYEPIENTNWSMATVVPRYMIDMFGIFIGVVMLILIGIAMLVTRIAGRYIIKRATKPLKQLAVSANEVAKGNFDASLPIIKHNDEIHLLRDSFEGMQHSLSAYIEELKLTTASKAAIENELKVAHDIQMSMLPKKFPPYPERHDIDIYGMLTPAKDVGGDLFDFYIHNEKLFFCIGDVSGKGVPASLLMAVTRSLFRNISAHIEEPDKIVSALNNAIVEGNDTNMFVTLFMGVLDLTNGQLNYCNAGHNAPMLIDQGISLMPCNPNLPLGIMQDWEYTLQKVELKSPTTLFLYTDGLNEAENIHHDQFGTERVIQLAEEMFAKGTPHPIAIVEQMAETVHSFVGNAEQSDDLTMLAINYIKANGK